MQNQEKKADVVRARDEDGEQENTDSSAISTDKWREQEAKEDN